MTVASTQHVLSRIDEYFDLAAYPPNSSDDVLGPLYALRFAIYCEECGFLAPDDYPEQVERDDYDASSAHFAARNADGQVVGTSRLVLADAGGSFPFESFCSTFDDFSLPDPSISAEVSRLAVDRAYRRRSGDTLSGVNPKELAGPKPKDGSGKDKRVNAPLLVLGLYREMYRYSHQNGIRYWYAAMERNLARILGMYGFVFKPIGPEQDYYGPVTPYLGDLRDLEDHVRGHNPQLLEWFQHG